VSGFNFKGLIAGREAELAGHDFLRPHRCKATGIAGGAGRHYTVGQRAYIAARDHAADIEAARARRLAIMRSGGRVVPAQTRRFEDIAATLKVSETLLKQAVRIRNAFASDDRLRARIEPHIMAVDSPISLSTAQQMIADHRSAQ
jgi:hypothetical protein